MLMMLLSKLLYFIFVINKNTSDFVYGDVAKFTFSSVSLLVALGFFLICNHVCNSLPFISLVVPLARISNIMINRNGHTRNLFLFLSQWKCFQYLPIKYAMWSLEKIFITLREFSSTANFWRSFFFFIINLCSILSNALFASTEMVGLPS